VQDFGLVLIKHSDGHSLGVEHLLHHQPDVHLLADLLQRPEVDFHPLPRQLDADRLEEGVDQVADEDEEVEVIALERHVAIVVVEVLGDFHFIGDLVVLLHDEQHSHDGAEESPDVRECVVHLAEGALHLQRERGLANVELEVVVLPDFVVDRLCWSRGNAAFG